MNAVEKGKTYESYLVDISLEAYQLNAPAFKAQSP
jgi:hypothetical protein